MKNNKLNPEGQEMLEALKMSQATRHCSGQAADCAINIAIYKV